MIFSQRGSCSPRSLGRRRVEVGVGVIVVVIISVGVVLLVLFLILLLRVLLIGAPWRTIIRRHSVVEGDVLLEGLVGWQVVIVGRQAAWKLDGAVTTSCLET
jgi:hypothetical protein